jgi:hypothetical protein
MAAAWLFVAVSRSTTTELAFWFEPISDEARSRLPARLAGNISTDDMKVIEAVSREEVVRAFDEYPIEVVGRVGARYHVRVVDGLSSRGGGSAESYVLPGLGGQGFVNFRSIAFGAINHAPADANRDQIIAAIGRGIGRAAVHEFTHQLLGRQAPIDSSKDIESYEYGSTDRRAQYYGPIRWDLAAPLLRQKFGLD